MLHKKGSLLFVLGFLLSINTNAENKVKRVSDTMPFIGMRSKGNCNHNDVKFNGDAQQPVRVMFDKDCNTAFIFPPNISYSLTELPTFSPAAMDCPAYYSKRSRKRAYEAKIEELEIKEFNSGLSPQEEKDLRKYTSKWRRLDKDVRKQEKEFSSRWGANMNMYVSFDAWGSAVEQFKVANPEYTKNGKAVNKLPVSLGLLGFVTTKVSSVDVDEYEIDENFDVKILRDYQTTAPRLDDSFTQAIVQKYSLAPKVDDSVYLFGTSANVLTEMSLYGACLLDKNGDGKVNEVDDLSAGSGQKIGNFLTFGYSYFYPIRTGIYMKASITDYEALKSIIDTYAGSNELVTASTLYKKIAESADLIDVEVIDAVDGVLNVTSDVQRQLEQDFKQEIVEVLLGKVASRVVDSATSNQQGESRSYIEHGVCQKKFLGICYKRGPEIRWKTVQVTNWTNVKNELIKTLENASTQERVIYGSNERFDVVGSKFFIENKKANNKE